MYVVQGDIKKRESGGKKPRETENFSTILILQSLYDVFYLSS